MFNLSKTIPVSIVKIIKILNEFIFSFKKMVLKIKAKIIEVSRKDETIAIGKYTHAHTTIA